MKLIYLATPYTHQSPSVELLRETIVTAVASELIRQNFHVFSPITESAQYKSHGIRGDWSFWEKHDKLMLRKCDEIWVLTIPGWEKSIGVTSEIEYAKRHKMPIKYVKISDVIPEFKEALGLE